MSTSFENTVSLSPLPPVVRITYNREWQEFKYYDEAGNSGFTCDAEDAWVSANDVAHDIGGIVVVSSSAKSRIAKVSK